MEGQDLAYTLALTIAVKVVCMRIHGGFLCMYPISIPRIQLILEIKLFQVLRSTVLANPFASLESKA